MTRELSDFRNPTLARQLVSKIAAIGPAAVEACDGHIKLMEVCGTHTVALARYGIRSILPQGITLISGPGCPVCVTANNDIDTIIALARLKDVIITTFGDMTRVPGSSSSLNKEKANGADIRICYSPLDGLQVACDNPGRQVIFVGVGFETTTPLIASTVMRARAKGIENFSVFAAHKTVPHTLEALVNDPEVDIDALILPGHVSTIIGRTPYLFLAEHYHIPGVIMGFEPIDLLSGIFLLLNMLACGRADIINDYGRAVRDEGNPDAQAAIQEVFEPCAAHWRGLGYIDDSGYRLREKYADFDATKRFKVSVEKTIEPRGCRCGDVLRGRLAPSACPLFAHACSPEHPVGPCMVSSEGSCAAFYKYLR